MLFSNVVWRFWKVEDKKEPRLVVGAARDPAWLGAPDVVGLMEFDDLGVGFVHGLGFRLGLREVGLGLGGRDLRGLDRHLERVARLVDAALAFQPSQVGFEPLDRLDLRLREDVVGRECGENALALAERSIGVPAEPTRSGDHFAVRVADRRESEVACRQCHSVLVAEVDNRLESVDLSAVNLLESFRNSPIDPESLHF